MRSLPSLSPDAPTPPPLLPPLPRERRPLHQPDPYLPLTPRLLWGAPPLPRPAAEGPCARPHRLDAYNSLVDALSKASLFRDDRGMLDDMLHSRVKPDVATYSCILTVLIDWDRYLDVLNLFTEMQLSMLAHRRMGSM
ncbi:uncharacterized protein A4U43_C01F35560 [Asparagus officinalis]|uniref:Pentatricopeptide repeat-containing protein n=2 Tax=Asparagus officinalis TaxID=4686 RepID=A0A5P1FUM0_ASPOF|nr:uncharacterized protein A4U43_C01F35560 [Asparagus officinalis]